MVKSLRSLPCQAICFAAVLCLAFPAFAQNGVRLEGKVQMANGRGIGVAVSTTLENQANGFHEKGPVDSDGNFKFSNLPHAIYTLKVSAEGFAPYQQSEDLSSPLLPYSKVQVILMPVVKRTVNVADAPSLTDLAAPKNARKEFEKARHAWKAHNLKEEQKHAERAIKAYPCYARALTVLGDLELDQKQLTRISHRQVGVAGRTPIG